jgi:tetratricopeptide (TPR) repeat protein
MIENSSTDERVALAAPRKLCSLILGLLLLALGGKAASASDPELCDRAGADPDAGIPACTRLLDHPSKGTNVPAVYNQRAVAKVRKGDLDGAVKDVTSALDRNPNYADAYKNRGIARHIRGAYDGAIADFNRALRLNDKSPDFYNARGTALFKKARI